MYLSPCGAPMRCLKFTYILKLKLRGYRYMSIFSLKLFKHKRAFELRRYVLSMPSLGRVANAVMAGDPPLPVRYGEDQSEILGSSCS